MNFKTEITILTKTYCKDEEGIGSFRYSKLKKIFDYYQANGFPEPCSQIELSLVPAFFQEAIYDGYDWFDQNADLGGLTSGFELDCMFQNQGKTRKELSSEEFERYIMFSRQAIDFIIEKNRASQPKISMSREEVNAILKAQKRKSFWSWLFKNSC